MSLPLYPSLSTLGSLSPSQLAEFKKSVPEALEKVISLPASKLDTPSIRAFLTSYLATTAHAVLRDVASSRDILRQDKSISGRVLTLASKLPLKSLTDQNILDITIIFARSYTARVRSILASYSTSSEIIAAFTVLLASTAEELGFEALRRAAYCLSSIVHVLSQDALRNFSRNSEFILTLARAYDHSPPQDEQLLRLVLETKVDLIDTFHILLRQLLQDVTMEENRDVTFGVIFSLLDLQSSTNGITPFFDRPLLTDYQHAYDLSSTLSSVLRDSDDARVDLLQSSLHTLSNSNQKHKDPGALKMLIHSSGAPPSISYSSKGKGKAAEEADVPESAVAQVSDILPDYSPTYIRALLRLPAYAGDPEKVIEALLEGRAPSEEEISHSVAPADVSSFVQNRQNIFDEEKIDTSQLRIGKKETSVELHDRKYIEQMKADILRRAQELSSDEEEDDSQDIAFDDDDGAGAEVRVVGDGEGSSEEEEEEEKQSVETVLELLYIAEGAKPFERDAQTRRSAQRQQLRERTGWANEQIEGWHVMLERNPNKDRVLAKHEFSGNRNVPPPAQPSSLRGSRGRGGRGRGGGGGRGGSQGESSRDKALKDKNKASRGNHNRKRGHDKKMRGALPPSM